MIGSYYLLHHRKERTTHSTTERSAKPSRDSDLTVYIEDAPRDPRVYTINMSTEYRDQPKAAHTSPINMPSASRTSNHLPHDAPIEPGHSLSTGLQLVQDQSKEDGHSDVDDEYGHQFVMKRLKRNLPLPGRWTLLVMLYVPL